MSLDHEVFIKIEFLGVGDNPGKPKCQYQIISAGPKRRLGGVAASLMLYLPN
jgi:hypothetical protein